jgi:large subunit ribosomal protein L9
MRVILLQDIPKIGRKYDMKDISDGHAMNYLLPRGLVLLATPDTEVRFVKLWEQREKARKQEEELLLKNLNLLQGKVIETQQKANNKGHLFAGLKKERISEIIKEQLKIEVPATIIELKEPIKELGEHKVLIKVLAQSFMFILKIASV